MEKIQYIRLPFDLGTLPEGWFSKGQANILYQLALMNDGPILEIGPWIGRSTAVICHALSQKEKMPKFYTVDYGISSEEEWTRLFGTLLKNKANSEKYLPHILQAGGSITSLKRNLDSCGFADFVTIIRGDFHDVCPQGKFSLIFCDATHNVEEIDRNVPVLLSKLQIGGIFACDDINPKLEDYLRQKFDWKWCHTDSLLFYGQPND